MRGFAVVYLILGLGLVLAVVGGFYLTKVYQKPIPTIPQLSQSTPTPNIIDDEISNWKTYTNSSVKLSFMYPLDTRIEEKIDSSIGRISIIHPLYEDRRALSDPELGTKAYKIDINIEDNPTNLTVQQVVDAEISEGLKSKDPTRQFLAKKAKDSIKSYTVGNAQGIYMIAGESRSFPLIYEVQNGKIYKISYHILQEIPSPPVAQLAIDRILSTFKFLAQETQTDSASIRKIDYSSVNGWVEFKSVTSYSFEHPKAFYDTSRIKGESFQSNICSLYLGNDAGGVLAAKVVPYDGGSRRALFFSIYPQLEQSYTYKFEDVMVQDRKSLLIELGPLGESGSGTAAVIPNGNNALILFWDHRGKDSTDFNNLLQSIKFNGNFNLSSCGK